MKLSELSTDRALDTLCELTPCILFWNQHSNRLSDFVIVPQGFTFRIPALVLTVQHIFFDTAPPCRGRFAGKTSG